MLTSCRAQPYQSKRRNAVAYNPDRSCTDNEDILIAHIMSIKPVTNTFSSKFIQNKTNKASIRHFN